jgi:GntR family transcriptional regulator
VPAFQLNIATGSGTPIYRQIVDQVRLAAATGDLPAGHAMPSVRSVAERLLINVNTVVKAYGELVRDGVLEPRQGLGFFRRREAASLQQGRAPAAAASGPGRLRPRGRLSRLHR